MEFLDSDTYELGIYNQNKKPMIWSEIECQYSSVELNEEFIGEIGIWVATENGWVMTQPYSYRRCQCA